MSDRASQTDQSSTLLDTPRHRDLIYDVGLHRGEDTLFYLKKRFRVVAFEANPGLAAECRKRLREYIESGQLTIVEGAIVEPGAASLDGTVTFFDNDTHGFLGTTSRDWVERNDRAGYGTSYRELTVPAIDFARELARHGIPYYLKIDIEGADMVCVRTLKQFRERPDFLSIESDKRSMAGIREEMRELRELGYKKFKAIEQSSIPEVQAGPNPPLEGKLVTDTFEAGSSGLFGRELPGRWRSATVVTCRYAMIHLSYVAAGDLGFVWKWEFKGSYKLRALILRILAVLSGGPVPCWYDTHARHRSARETAFQVR